MRRDDITERRALVKNVIPGEWKITLRTRPRTILQRQISDHPRAKMKLSNVRRRIVAIRPHDVARHKLRRRKDHARRVESARILSFLIERDDVNTAVSRYQLDRRAIELNVFFRFRKQVLDETPIALRPRNQRLRFNSRRLHTRTEVKQSGPGARLFERHSVVVATGVVDPPAQTRTREAARVEPIR